MPFQDFSPESSRRMGSSCAGRSGTRYDPVNHRARSMALHRAEQKGNDAFSSRAFTGRRQLGHGCM